MRTRYFEVKVFDMFETRLHLRRLLQCGGKGVEEVKCHWALRFEFCKENKSLIKMNLRVIVVGGKEEEGWLRWEDGSESK